MARGLTQDVICGKGVDGLCGACVRMQATAIDMPERQDKQEEMRKEIEKKVHTENFSFKILPLCAAMLNRQGVGDVWMCKFSG